MATLAEIWADRSDMTRVAARLGALSYVPLGIKNPDDLDLSDEDRAASDWEVCDLIGHDCDALGHDRCPKHGAGEVVRG